MLNHVKKRLGPPMFTSPQRLTGCTFYEWTPSIESKKAFTLKVEADGTHTAWFKTYGTVRKRIQKITHEQLDQLISRYLEHDL